MRLVAALATVGACLLLTACGDADSPQETAAPTQPAVPSVPAPKLEDLPAPYNTADLAKGKAKFAMCASCHTIKEGGANMTGPNLHGVFGRKAGSLPDFNYSDAIKEAGFIWDADKLDHWLAEPRTFMPGTKMTFAGLKDEKDRIDLIGYLTLESAPKP